MARRASAEAIQTFNVGGPGLLRLRLRSLGFGGQVGGQVARNDVTGRTISFPRRHCVRALHRNCPSGNRGRREGRAPAAPAAPVHQKARGRNHRWRRSHPAFPAQWCYGLYALSPGTGRGPGFLAPVARKPLIERIASLASASGGQDHTISPSASASVVSRKAPDLPRPSHPASYVRDDRETPLVWRRDGRDDASDLGRRQV
jgi:hypothetical protein